jgi:hypothetical protein
MSEKRMNDELAAAEAMLGSLTPAASSVDRDRLMFLAGRASAERLAPPRHRSAWLWPSATAAMTTAAAVLLVMVLAQPRQLPTEQGLGANATMSLARSDDSYRAVLQARRSSAGAVLPNDLFALSNALASNSFVLAGHYEATQEPLSSFELTRRMLRDPGLAEVPVDRSPRQPSDFQRSKL